MEANHEKPPMKRNDISGETLTVNYQNLPQYEATAEKAIKDTDTSQTSLPYKEVPLEDVGVPYVGDSENAAQYGVNFSQERQFWEFFRGHLFWWLVNVALAALYAGGITAFEKAGALGDAGRRLFNTFTVAIPLLMAITTGTMLKGLAGIVRWKILAHGRYTARETDLILNFSSYRAVATLFFKHLLVREHWRHRHHWGLPIFYCAWVFLMVASQIASGLLGLAFDSEKDTLLATRGEVLVTNLTYYAAKFDAPKKEPSLSQQQWLAHALGDQSWAAVQVEDDDVIPTDSDLRYGGTNITHLNSTDTTTMITRLRDWTYGDEAGPQSQGVWSATSNRYVSVEVSCTYYKILNMTISQLSNNADWWQPSEWLTDPAMRVVGDMTYLNNDYNTTGTRDDLDGSGNDILLSEYLCGSRRCAQLGVYAFANETDGDFYLCSSTVSNVENTRDPAHFMSDLVARLAAGAIGLDGISNEHDGAQSNYQQYSRYSNETAWGFSGGLGVNVSRVEYLISQFAAGSIAQLDFYGPKVENPVQGIKAYAGTRFFKKEPDIWILLGLFIGIQFLLILPIILLGSRVLVLDESAIATAMFLKPMIEPLESVPDARAASGKQLAARLDKRDPLSGLPKRKWTYAAQPAGVDASGVNIYHPRLIVDSGTGVRPDRFREGRYL